MFKFLRESFDSKISAPLPVSNLEISNEKKVDIIISLLGSFRNTVQAWTERAYKTTIWSIGIMLSIVGYWVLHGGDISGRGRLFFSIALVVFGLLTQLYLQAAQRAHRGNGIAIAKCEAVLNLCNKDSYFAGERFFGYSGKWLPSKSLTILQIFHGVILGLSICSIVFIDPISKSIH
jgi:hypothetical protein